MAVGLTLEQAIATVKHVMGQDVFRVDADPQLAEDPAPRLINWDHDINEGARKPSLDDYDAMQEFHGEGGESVGPGSIRKVPVRYD